MRQNILKSLSAFVPHLPSIIWLEILFALFVCIQVSYISAIAMNGDFFQDYFAGLAIIQNKSIYQEIIFRDDIVINAHPPITAVIFIPFALMPSTISYFVYDIFSFLLIFVALVLVARQFNITKVTHLAVLFGFLIWPSVLELLRFGQVNSIVLFCCLFFITQVNTKRKYLGSILLGLAVSLKLFPALLYLGYIQ